MIKHNCCKECKFKWVAVDITGLTKDKLICEICGRIFEEYYIDKILEEI